MCKLACGVGDALTAAMADAKKKLDAAERDVAEAKEKMKKAEAARDELQKKVKDGDESLKEDLVEAKGELERTTRLYERADDNLKEAKRAHEAGAWLSCTSECGCVYSNVQQ